MSIPTKTRQWILAKKPTAEVNISEVFKLEEKELPSLEDGQVLLKTLFLSNDPAQRGWIQEGQDPERLYVPPVPQGAPMRARGIAKVIDSKASKLPKDSLVAAGVDWTEYSVLKAEECTPIQKIGELSESHFLGALGFTGLTALYGLEVVRAGKDDVVVISGAAGATGSMAVQIAKHLLGSKRVIGIAGSDDKCRWVESLGADVCVNYKSSSFAEDLQKATEGNVNVYFDNVGGEILDLLLTRMARHGRIAACGAIANYNRGGNPIGLKNWFEVIITRIEIRGFIILDAAPRFAELTKTLIQGYKDGKLKIGEDNETVITTDFSGIPQTWMKLFSGANTGKLVTKL